MNLKTVLIAFIAGLASALCLAASTGVGLSASPLLLVAAFPIYVATLSQGPAVGVGSSILAIVIAATLINVNAGVALGLAFTIPASIVGNQVNLAQDDEGTVEWYPLSRLFFNLCALIAFGLVVLGYLSGYNPQELSPVLSNAVKQALEANPPAQALSDAEVEQLVKSVFNILPFFFAGIWLIVHIISLYFAAMVCRASNMMPRPKDDIAMTIGLPKMALLIMLGSLVISFALSGIFKLLLLVVAGVFVMAFSLIGLANLHMRARNTTSGMVMVIASYASIFFFYPVLYLFSISGVLRVFNQPNINKNPPHSAD